MLPTRATLLLHRAGGPIDAIIVTHDSAEQLRTQLSCVPLRSAFDRILVVDNASSDGSTEMAREAGVELIERDRNDSFAAAINEGVRRSSSELFAVLNPDVLLDDPEVVEALERCFDDPAVGLAAPALRLPHGGLQDSARTVPSPIDLARRRFGRKRLGAIPADRLTDVDWVVGAFVVVRRTAFEEVGGFDERYRLYFEDVDFCVRMWSHGWRVRLNPDVVARHEHRAFSRGSMVSWATRQHVRSAALFFLSHPDLALPTGRRRLVRARR
jgi:N-acetylglucosaminyl-diphospho-decaprenol L-rhamnosyltransferase